MKTIKSILRGNFYLLLFVAVFSISSCSDDKETECLPGIAELPATALGAYGGVLTLNGNLITTSGTATLETSSCKTYTVTFSDNVPSVTDVKFTLKDDVYTYVGNNGTTSVVINDGELTVATTTPSLIAFNGSK